MKFAISNFEIVLITSDGVRTISLDHPFYVEICRALQAGKDDDVMQMVNARETIAQRFEKIGTDVTVTEDAAVPSGYTVEVDGLNITGRLAEMITKFRQKGMPFKALVNFWKKVQENPNATGRESIIKFLTANHVPLLPNGNFLAYKGVFKTSDPYVFQAQHDRTFTYRLGHSAKLDRELCTVDVHNACGPGLHVGGFQHASTYGDTILDCEVDPKDVVSVPTSEQMKLRACSVLPVRVNPDKKFYAEEYVDLQAETICSSDKLPTVIPAPIIEKQADITSDQMRFDTQARDFITNKLTETERIRANRKLGRKNKVMWYRVQGKRVMVQRRVLAPGPEWSTIKPTSSVKGSKVKAMKLKGSEERRTWYSPKGERVRAVNKPGPTWSSHKRK